MQPETIETIINNNDTIGMASVTNVPIADAPCSKTTELSLVVCGIVFKW